KVLRARELAHLEHNVRERARAAGKRLARGLFLRMQRALLVVAVSQLAGAQHALARAARAVAATVRQADALTQRRLEDGLALGDGERVAARLQANLAAVGRRYGQVRKFLRIA